MSVLIMVVVSLSLLAVGIGAGLFMLTRQYTHGIWSDLMRPPLRAQPEGHHWLSATSPDSSAVDSPTHA